MILLRFCILTIIWLVYSPCLLWAEDGLSESIWLSLESEGPALADAETVLNNIDRRVEEIRTLTANYEQHRYTPLLKEPLVSKGRVRVVPTMTRWDTHQPRPSVMVSESRTLKIYDPQAVVLEVYELEEHLAGLMFSPLPRLAILRQYFVLTVQSRLSPDVVREGEGDGVSSSQDEIYCIRLTPRDQWSGHMQRAVAGVDARQGVIRWVVWLDPDGDRTAIRFTDVKRNVELSPQMLTLELPDHTRVVHPLEAWGGDTP